MKNLSSRPFRLALFASIYFVQGSALAYLRNFLKPFLDSQGIDADTIGLLAGIMLVPFILKPFIGILSDRVNLFGWGHRKPYIIIGLIVTAISFAFASFTLPVDNFLLFAVLILIGGFNVALFDSTADGLAIDTTPPEEEGLVQGTMVGGRAVGFIILSLVFGSLVETQGNSIIFLIIAGSMLLPLFFVFRIKEPAKRAATQQFDWAVLREAINGRFAFFAAYAIFYSMVAYGIDGLVTFFMSDQFQATERSIGQYGALRGVGAVVGALLGALLLGKIGRRTGGYIAFVLVSISGVLLATATSINWILAVGLFWGMAWGFQETIFVAMAMNLADKRIAATMFALMMAISNVGVGIGEGVATGLTDDIGFTAVFWILVGINFVNVPILLRLFKDEG